MKDRTEEAERLYEEDFGHISVIAKKLALRTRLTQDEARSSLKGAAVERIAELLAAYGEVG